LPVEDKIGIQIPIKNGLLSVLDKVKIRCLASNIYLKSQRRSLYRILGREYFTRKASREFKKAEQIWSVSARIFSRCLVRFHFVNIQSPYDVTEL
jgi:hypothetical protein